MLTRAEGIISERIDVCTEREGYFIGGEVEISVQIIKSPHTVQDMDRGRHGRCSTTLRHPASETQRVYINEDVD